MGKITVSNAASVDTPASGKTTLYVDSTTKQLVSHDDAGTTVAYGAGESYTWTTWGTVTINNGGTLTYTTAKARYMIKDKLLFAHFEMTQTAAGSGTTDITIDPPGGVTLLDMHNCGTFTGFDIGNDNAYRVHGVEAVNSTNKFKIYRNTTTTYIRGGSFIGNNGTSIFGFQVVCGIE